MFPDKLKTLRKEAKLTQVEISKKLNISQPAYVDWEKGRTQPTPDKLPLLAEILNTSIDYLLGKTDIKNSSDIDEDALEQSLKKSIGFNGKPATDEEIENMKNALIDYLKNH